MQKGIVQIKSIASKPMAKVEDKAMKDKKKQDTRKDIHMGGYIHTEGKYIRGGHKHGRTNTGGTYTE